jgi:hypothetical protein
LSERTSRRGDWLLGLIIGLVFGVASLIAGTIGVMLGLMALAFLAFDRARSGTVGAALLGFGVSWSTILLMADARCGEGCVGPDLTPWYVIGTLMIAVGAGLSVLAVGRLKGG